MMGEQMIVAGFTLPDGYPVTINLTLVNYFHPSKEGTSIFLAGGY